MQPDDLALLRTPGPLTVTPDGRLICYALTSMDLAEDAYRSELWAVPSDGSAPARRLTRGDKDGDPRCSPDGRWLAFTRAVPEDDGDDGPPQLWLLPLAGGDARQVTDHPLGVSEAEWAPDSRRVAYVARVPEEGRYGTAEGITPAKEPPRHITTLRYRADGLGWTIDRRAHVFVHDALAALEADDESAAREPGSAEGPQQATRGDFDHSCPAWSPDGRRLAFISARHAERDLDLAADVWLADVDGTAAGDARPLTAATTDVVQLAFTTDGASVVFTGTGEPLDLAGRPTGLWSVPVDGSAAPRRLTDEETDDLDNLAGRGPQRLVVDADAVVATRCWRGAVELCRFPLDGGEPTVLCGGRRQVPAHAAAGPTRAAIVTTDVSAGEVAVVGQDPDAPRVLTDHGATLSRRVPLQGMRELTATAEDGATTHGWVVTPPGQGPHPVLLAIHGGPYTQYGYTLFDEAQVYAGAGYAVVLGNPRGAQGYGLAHGRAIVHRMGEADQADLLALLDAAVADPALSADRVGVMGGSYGGFMTTWLAAHTDRFAAGISERSLNAFDSFAGSSDIGAFFPALYAGPDEAAWTRQSPLSYAEDIDIPMLLIHSEQDWRCPLEQAQRLYERLRRNGTLAEMLIFPGEGHELSRSGLPSHRVARFEAILAWWQRWLPVDGGG